MRGIGRLKDAGFETFWGPGRHGPGNNVFAYFVAPFRRRDRVHRGSPACRPSYKVGGPQDWKWPPKRNDHWGISARNHPGGSEFRFRRSPSDPIASRDAADTARGDRPRRFRKSGGPDRRRRAQRKAQESHRPHSTLLWVTDEAPAGNSESEDSAERDIGVAPPACGSIFRVVDFPPPQA